MSDFGQPMFFPGNWPGFVHWRKKPTDNIWGKTNLKNMCAWICLRCLEKVKKSSPKWWFSWWFTMAQSKTMQKSHQTHPSAPQKSNIDTKTCHFFKGVTFPIFIILGSGSLNNQVDFYPLKITGTPRIKVDQKKNNYRYAKLLFFFRAFWEKISGIPP